MQNNMLFNTQGISYKNSNIYKTPEEHHLFDLSQFGTTKVINKQEVMQKKHYFRVGDAIYYDIQEKKFALALAINDINSEVVGLVSEIINEDIFMITNTGELITNRYSFPIGTQLYLSNIVPGKLVSMQPSNVIKPIATQSNNGIIIDIGRGWIPESPTSDEVVYENYTREELDEIINNIW